MIVLSIALIIGIYRVSSFHFYNGLAPCHNLRCVCWFHSNKFFPCVPLCTFSLCPFCMLAVIFVVIVFYLLRYAINLEHIAHTFAYCRACERALVCLCNNSFNSDLLFLLSFILKFAHRLLAYACHIRQGTGHSFSVHFLFNMALSQTTMCVFFPLLLYLSRRQMIRKAEAKLELYVLCVCECMRMCVAQQ